ncbi:hypothetical protein [Rhodopirellula halodulae]|uniref:hypothetical protein n=1 Tax=Rhodopirellula halodulae TaxID=2894198 RepID=UPI001E317022|nr:hypothetical protein [Rhodopirellula sp. JC737]
MPRIRSLERRVVLNATAELTALGDLFVQGDAGADSIESVITNDDRLQFIDSVTGVIPITIGQDAFGNDIRVDSIGVDEIPNGHLRVDLGGGNDSLRLRLPDALDTTIHGGIGNDSVYVEVLAPTTIGNQVNIAAETTQVDGDVRTSFELLPELGLSEIALQSLTTNGVGSVDLGEVPVEALGDVQLNDVTNDVVFESDWTAPNVEISTAGSVTQLPGTSLQWDRVDIQADAGVVLDQPANQFGIVGVTTSGADVRLSSETATLIDQIDAGRGRIELSAASINDWTDDELADFIAEELRLEAVGGIGDIRVLELQSVDQLDVIVGDGEVNLKSLSAGESIVSRVELNSGDYRLEQVGGQTVTLESVVVNQGSVWVRNDADVIVEYVFAGNGSVDIHADGELVVVDDDPSDDGPDRSLDPEIIASGTNGQVRLTSAVGLRTTDDVQIQASSIEAGAVTLSAPAIAFGNRFEINTGGGVGIARQFTPRPELDPEDLVPPNPDLPPRPAAPPVAPGPNEVTEAFYQHDSIRTNILSQFAENDAEGILSVNVGVEGENGLTLIIDWGAETERFQRVDDLPGSFQTASVSHVYTEEDILSSTLNGRGSATDPLNVRFAVQHHESIVVLGDTITQPDVNGEAVAQTVAGGLISSTDNPNTFDATGPVLESGAAFFVIPRVNVPLAFLPVRDVIPEPIDPVTPVVPLTTTTISQVVFETSESTSSPSSIREEFFQLRALSPDPRVGDLIDPVRLPDRALDNQTLQQLFSELPDGKYEIQYVAGESDERTILNVELRDGKPIQTGDDLEAGTLRLKTLDLEELNNRETSETESEVVREQSDLEALPQQSPATLDEDEIKRIPPKGLNKEATHGE